MGAIIFKTTTRGGKSGGASIPDGSIDKSKLSTDVQKSLTAADGSVRFDAAQELTVAQMEQVAKNEGVPTVFFDNSELGKVLSEERAAQVESTTILAVSSSLGLRLFFRTLDESGRIWFTCTRSSSSIDSIYFYHESRQITTSQNSIYTDRGAVRYDNPQNLTTSQQSRARTNIDAMKNTPSGDPMHYMYETAGAEWIPYADISTEGLEDWQIETLDTAQAQADGGVWWHNDIFVTVEQNRINYVLTIGYYPTQLNSYNLYLTSSAATTNYKEYNKTGFSPISAADACRATLCKTIYFPAIQTTSLLRSFSNNTMLYRILGIVNIHTTNTSISGILNNSPNVRDVQIKGINSDIELSTNVNLNVASVAYMITNAGTATLTITLAPAVYAAAMADADVQAALTAKPNVTLADAGGSSGGN